MFAIFAVPLAGLFWRSLVNELSSAFSIAVYQKIFTSSLFYKVAWNTLAFIFLGTLFALLMGYPRAYYLSKKPPRIRAMLMILVLIPFWTSILVKSFAFTIILGNSGIINTFLNAVGLPSFKLLFNRTGVIIGMSNFLIPFMVFPILTSLLSQPPELARAAEIMGATRSYIFFKVTFPLSMPGVMAGTLIVMILSTGVFVLPALLGSRKDMMLANLVDFYTRETLNWQMSSALSVILLLTAGFFALVLSKIPGGSTMLGGEDH